MEKNMVEVGNKFGLEQDYVPIQVVKADAAQALQNKEDRRDDIRLNKMAKQAQKFLTQNN